MKLTQFIILLLRRGSLFQKPIDFESSRRTTIGELELDIPLLPPARRNAFRSFFLGIPGGYSLMANLSYLRNARTMNNLYYVSATHKVIYVRILKAAGTSVLKGFLPLVDKKLNNVLLSEEQVDTLGYYYAKREIDSTLSQYRKFALVRDPYRRIVSVYLDLFDRTSPVFTYATYWFGILEKSMSFKDFIRVIHKIPHTLLGPHFSPQHQILKPLLNETIVFSIERDIAALGDFLRQYNISLPHLNKQGAEYDYRTFYDKESFAMVSKLYHDDVQHFDYKAESAVLEKFVNDNN